MLAWTFTEPGKYNAEPLIVGSADVELFQEIVLLDESIAPQRLGQPYCVEIILIDWASVIEIDAIIIDTVSVETVFPSNSLLFSEIGTLYSAVALAFYTSRECVVDRRLYIMRIYNLSRRGERFPFLGYLSAFPSVTQRLLRDSENDLVVAIRTLAYPGMTLVSPAGEADGSMARGMVERFFHVSDDIYHNLPLMVQAFKCSPWTTFPWFFKESPSVIVIALGKTLPISPTLLSLSLDHRDKR
jgi:hypothetical protein